MSSRPYPASVVFDPLATLPADRVALLRQLLDEVLLANRQFNLTAVREPEEAWVKHIVDSLQGLRTSRFEAEQSVIDVGTGAGFPGLPLAIARPQLKLTLLEATRKKCSFLEAVSAKLGLQVTVLNARAEDAGQDPRYRERFAIATARAVGSLSEVCELCLPLVEVGGHTVLWRGSKVRDEVKESRRAMRKLGGEVSDVISYRLPGQGLDFHLVIIAKTAATPKGYPRRVGLPKQKPL